MESSPSERAAAAAVAAAAGGFHQQFYARFVKAQHEHKGNLYLAVLAAEPL
jgi:hypothetical protein